MAAVLAVDLSGCLSLSSPNFWSVHCASFQLSVHFTSQVEEVNETIHRKMGMRYTHRRKSQRHRQPAELMDVWDEGEGQNHMNTYVCVYILRVMVARGTLPGTNISMAPHALDISQVLCGIYGMRHKWMDDNV